MTCVSSIRVCTFNVRYDAPEEGHKPAEDSWGDRLPRVVETLATVEPDLLGLQETYAHQFEDVSAALDQYEWYGVGRQDGQQAGEFAPVAWLRDRFEAIETGVFWLSETPEKPSQGWDADLERIATWTVLQETATDRCFWFCNTHFDYCGERARRESAHLLAERAARHGDETIASIVTGDFNCTPDSSSYEALTGVFVDAGSAANRSTGRDEELQGTFHGFEGDLDGRIDYVFVSPSVEVPAYQSLEPRTEKYRSDHVPVIAELEPADPRT